MTDLEYKLQQACIEAFDRTENWDRPVRNWDVAIVLRGDDRVITWEGQDLMDAIVGLEDRDVECIIAQIQGLR
jgi:hypothetical protein